MPGGDQTGPLGEGRMTGRRMGICARVETIGDGNRFVGRGFGSGRGRGRFGQRFDNQQITSSILQKSTQKESPMIKSEFELLKNELDRMNQRIDTLISNLK